MVIQIGQLDGIFTGFHGRTTSFRFANGVRWQQAEDKLVSTHLITPWARIIAQQGVCFMEVAGLPEWMQVSRQHPCHD